MNWRRPAALALVALCAFGSLTVVSCSNKNASAGTADSTLPDDLGDLADLTGKTEVAIQVPDNSFSPKGFKVAPGTKVTFTNTGSNNHNVTADDEGTFDPLSLAPGASGSVLAPQKPGVYRFHCTIHGNIQRGAIIVVPPK